MSAFSQKMQGVATRLLGKFGSTINYVRAGSQTWDEVLGEYVTTPETIIPLTAVPVPINSSLIDGVTIQAGDINIIADFSVPPSTADKVDFDGARWSIVAVNKKQVNDDAITYVIQVRK